MVATLRMTRRGGDMAKPGYQKALARQARTRAEQETPIIVSLPTVVDAYHYAAGRLYRNGVALPRRAE